MCSVRKVANGVVATVLDVEHRLKDIDSFTTFFFF